MRFICSLMVSLAVVVVANAADGEVAPLAAAPAATEEAVAPAAPVLAAMEDAEVEQPDYKTRMQEMSKLMNERRRSMGATRLALRRKQTDLERQAPECKALAAEIATLKSEISAKEKALEAALAKDAEYIQLSEAVKQAEAALDTARKEVYGFVQEQKLKNTPVGVENEPSTPRQ